jgi:hypothetical protein
MTLVLLFGLLAAARSPRRSTSSTSGVAHRAQAMADEVATTRHLEFSEAVTVTTVPSTTTPHVSPALPSTQVVRPCRRGVPSVW